MDANRLMNMIGKLVFATLAKHLIQSWSRSAGARQTGAEPPDEADKAQTAQSRQLEKRTRDAMRMFRRLGR